MIFNSLNGSVGSGFIGYFNSSRPETSSAITINNPYSTIYSGAGVQVSELYNKPFCETIAGVRICSEEEHYYDTKEYYMPGIGICGFYRSGSSTYTGGGFGSQFSSTVNIWLVETNIK